MKKLFFISSLFISLNADINNIEDFNNYFKLIKNNDKNAYYEIAKAYYLGKVVKKNYNKAFYYFKKAHKFSHPKAKYNIGIIYANKNTPYYDLAESYDIFYKLSEEGNVAALNRLGMIYTFGIGKNKDYEKAINYYERASKKNNINAQCNLAFMYASGKGVFPNFGRAHAFAKNGKKLNNPICKKVWKTYNLGKYKIDKGWKFNFYTKP